MESNLTSVSVIRKKLKQHQVYPSKKLGQNFLVDGNILDKIVDAVDPSKSDLVIEIGAGLGTLTKALAQRAGHVVTVEKDRRIIPLLEENLEGFSNITIVGEDILKLPISDLVLPGADYDIIKAVGNLPYYVTSPIIMHLLDARVELANITCMVQREVALRMIAKPNTKEYGVLSVAVQAKSRPELVCYVPRTVFYPKPEVDSAVIRLVPGGLSFPTDTHEEYFFRVVKAAFGQRRKIISNALRAGLGMSAERISQVLVQAAIDPNCRGETLSPEEFYQIAQVLLEET